MTNRLPGVWGWELHYAGVKTEQSEQKCQNNRLLGSVKILKLVMDLFSRKMQLKVLPGEELWIDQEQKKALSSTTMRILSYTPLILKPLEPCFTLLYNSVAQTNKTLSTVYCFYIEAFCQVGTVGRVR
jgi:hypothetical protein